MSRELYVLQVVVVHGREGGREGVGCNVHQVLLRVVNGITMSESAV